MILFGLYETAGIWLFSSRSEAFKSWTLSSFEIPRGNEIKIIAKNKTWHLKSQLGTPNEPWIWPPNLRDGMDGMASSSPSFPPGKARPPLVASVHRKLRRCPAEKMKHETEEREKTNMCIKNHKEQERKTWIAWIKNWNSATGVQGAWKVQVWKRFSFVSCERRTGNFNSKCVACFRHLLNELYELTASPLVLV